jgi:ELWxxDGT repeat protein
VFSATNADGRSVWTTDGTEAGTTRVAVAPQPVGFFVAFGDHVYFAASDADGVELWRTDGTAPNTTQVMDIDDGGDSDPQGLIVRGGLLLFSADDGSGRELWSTDGTTTTAVIDLNPNLGDSAVLSDPFPVPGDRIGFAGTDGTGGIELGLSNGTLGGTALFEIATGALSSTPMFVGAMGTYTLFEAVGDDGELDLWRTDGTAGNTAMVLDYGVVGAVHGAPGVALDNGIVYALETTAQGIEPWFSNGSTQGSAIISDIVTDAGSSDPGMMGRIDDTVIMHLDDGVTGRELWRTDGTAGNTAMIVDLNGSGDGVDAFIGQIGGLIVFAGDDGSGTGLEPWVTDASQDGTVLLADVCTPTCDSVGPIN